MAINSQLTCVEFTCFGHPEHTLLLGQNGSSDAVKRKVLSVMRLLAATMACGRLGLRGLLRVCLHCCSLFVKTCPLFSFVVGNLLDFWETSVSVTCVSRLVSITGSLEWKFFWKCAFRCVRIGELEAAWLHQGGRGGRYCRLRISCGRLCVPTLQVLGASSRRHVYNFVKIGPASHPQPWRLVRLPILNLFSVGTTLSPLTDLVTNFGVVEQLICYHFAWKCAW